MANSYSPAKKQSFLLTFEARHDYRMNALTLQGGCFGVLEPDVEPSGQRYFCQRQIGREFLDPSHAVDLKGMEFANIAYDLIKATPVGHSKMDLVGYSEYSRVRRELMEAKGRVADLEEQLEASRQGGITQE